MRARLLAAVAAAVLTVAGAAPAAAQRDDTQRDDTQRGNGMVMASQTPWVAPGGEFALRLLVVTTGDRADIELAVAVHRPVTNRTAFAQTLEDQVRGTPITVATSNLAELTPDEAGAVVVRLPVEDLDPATATDRSRLQLGRSGGVYPVRVELRRTEGGEVLDTLTTHLLYATPTESPDLRLAWVMPIHAATTPGRDIDPAAADRINTKVQALTAHPAVPVTLSPTPATLAALARNRRGASGTALDGLTRLATDHQLLAEPFVPVSFNSLVASDLVAEATLQMNRSAEVLRSTLGVRPDPRTRLLDELPTPDTLDLLAEQQVDQLVLPDRGLSDPGLQVTLAQPFELAVDTGSAPRAVSVDAALSGHFTDTDDPVLAAHHFLAEAAMIHAEAPSRARGVVVTTPRSWRPSRAFLDAALSGLGSSPMVTTVTIDDLFTTVPTATVARGRPLVRDIVEADDPVRLPRNGLRAARARVKAFTGVLVAENPMTSELHDAVLAAQSDELRATERDARLDAIRDRIDRELAGLKMPTGRTITLTARRGEIPITVLSELGYAVQARLSFESDQLRFPGGQTRVVDLSRRNTTEVVEVRAQSSGAFPLRVRLESPDGDLVLASTRLTVRSTSASWVGVGLSVGAALFLVVWWARHFAKGRRNRRLVPA